MASRRTTDLVPPPPTSPLEPEPDQKWLGPDARGLVLAGGIDTLSPCWYAEPGLPLARARWARATQPDPDST
jgi:hypothetical protein